MWSKRRGNGFTLIELMIVTAIIAIIAAVAIPNLVRSKLASNEANAIGAMRTMSSAQTNFQGASTTDIDGDGIGEFGSFSLLSNATPAFVDDSLGSGQKSGYTFQVSTTGNVNTDERIWEGTAFPTSKGLTGNRTFYIDESGVLRGSDLGGAIGAAGVAATRAMADPSSGGNFPPIGN